MISPWVDVDSVGDLYVRWRIGYTEEKIVEFNPAGEALQILTVTPAPSPGYGEVSGAIAIAANGTIYAEVFSSRIGRSEVVEATRSSLTGPVEGQPTAIPHTQGFTGLAFDLASEQLFLSFTSSAEALNRAHEVVSRFGSGVISQGGELAVDEATDEVYVANRTAQNIDRFGPGLPGSAPAVDAPPPSLADVTRTSGLLSATIDPGNATTSWQLEYVAASEYEPNAANPYANGGSTPAIELAPSAQGTTVGPVPITGLLPGTTYHYRVLASNEVGVTDGPDHTFTTAAATPPLVATGAASEVTQTGVTLAGTVGTQELSTSYRFEVGTDTSYDGAKLFGSAGSAGKQTVSQGLQFLIPGTTYHYRLVASNADGTTYGQDMMFTTPSVSAPISQPPTAALILSPTGQFPSVAGAITKPHGSSSKGHKKQRKVKRRKKIKSKRKSKK